MSRVLQCGDTPRHPGRHAGPGAAPTPTGGPALRGAEVCAAQPIRHLPWANTAGIAWGTSLALQQGMPQVVLPGTSARVAVALLAAAVAGGLLGAAIGHLVGRLLPAPLVTGACVSASVALLVVAAHAWLGGPRVGRGLARAVLWGTLLVALAGQVPRVYLDYAEFRRTAAAALVAGPGAPRDPDLYVDLVLLAETGQPGFRGYLLASLGVERATLSLGRLRLRVLGHLLGIGVGAAVAAHLALAAVRARRCARCERRADRCTCGSVECG